MKTRSLRNQSNKATFADYINFFADDGNDLDVAGADEVLIQIREPRSKSILLEVSLTGGGVEVVDTGEILFTFTPEQMGQLSPQVYEFGVKVTVGDFVTQTHLCPLPVVEGL